jgi:DNA polymerase V
MEIIGKINPNDNEQVRKNWLPLYSAKLACGLFGISEDYVDSYLSLDEKFMQNKESTFFVRSGGDSMLPEIKAQDILVVDRSVQAKTGSIIAVFFNGNPLCKQLVFEGDKKILRSFNKNYEDIIVTECDEVQVFGVVIGLARDFF